MFIPGNMLLLRKWIFAALIFTLLLCTGVIAVQGFMLDRLREEIKQYGMPVFIFPTPHKESNRPQAS